jgi:hypothetical protein
MKRKDIAFSNGAGFGRVMCTYPGLPNLLRASEKQSRRLTSRVSTWETVQSKHLRLRTEGRNGYLDS